MSVQLIKDEKILRSYDYASSSARGLGATNGAKTLVITNKRIIHKESISGKKTTGTNISEMPVSAAKYVNTSFKITRYPVLFVLGCLFAFLAVVLLALGGATGGAVALSFGLFLVLLIVAGVCFLVYFLKKTYSFACSIDTDTRIANAFAFSSVSGDSRTKGLFAKFRRANKNFYIKVKVNPEVAQKMAEEMGCIIAAAANGDFDAIDAPAETVAE